jgi:NTE family protein
MRVEMAHARSKTPRVGLVLGAGGVTGGAWLVGALHAIATETGWDPASADRIVGTSAGSMVGSLCAGGVPPWFMVAHAAGESFEGIVDAAGRPAAAADRSAGAVFRPHRGLPRLGPGSPRLALAALVRPTRYAPAAALGAWAPFGLISTEPLEAMVRNVVPSGWADHPGLWIATCDYRSGRRVAFGRPGSPPAELADAVAASCAIPGFYRPVEIGGRLYVDGGACSLSNLDLLRDEGLDLVICLNPTTTRDAIPARTPGARARAGLRAAAGRRLGHEARRVREAGTDVLLIQPSARELEAIGPNPMSRRRRLAAIEAAIEGVTRVLREPRVARRLERLPAGEPHRVARPPGPPSSWPAIGPAAVARAAGPATAPAHPQPAVSAAAAVAFPGGAAG